MADSSRFYINPGYGDGSNVAAGYTGTTRTVINNDEANRDRSDDDYYDGDERGHRKEKDRKHRKKKRHRSRSRSRSRDRERRPRVHINPNAPNVAQVLGMMPVMGGIGMQQYPQYQQQPTGGGASALVALNNQLEATVNLRNQEIQSAMVRVNVLEQQLLQEKQASQQREKNLVNQLQAVNNKMRQKEDTEKANVQQLNTLKQTLELMRKENVGKTQTVEQLKTEMARYHRESAGLKEQSDFMQKRNEVLSKKCEQLAAASKTLIKERDELKAQAQELKTQQINLLLAQSEKDKDMRRLEGALQSWSGREKQWIKEKNEWKTVLDNKDQVICDERRAAEQAAKQSDETRMRLEQRLREKEGTEGEADLAIGLDSLSRLVSTYKTEWEMQVEYLKNQVEILHEERNRWEKDRKEAQQSDQRSCASCPPIMTKIEEQTEQYSMHHPAGSEEAAMQMERAEKIPIEVKKELVEEADKDKTPIDVKRELEDGDDLLMGIDGVPMDHPHLDSMDEAELLGE